MTEKWQGFCSPRHGWRTSTLLLKGCLHPFFHRINWDIPMLEFNSLVQLSSATSAIKPSVWLLISYLDILALRWDKLWQPEDTQASCKQIDRAPAVFQYEIIRPQKSNPWIINQSAWGPEMFWKLVSHLFVKIDTQSVQTVNPLASPSQQANDMVLSEHLRNWQETKGKDWVHWMKCRR